MPPSRPSDSRIDFLTPASRVPGLGPSRTAALAECGIETIGDLLYHFPHRYLDRSRIFSIADAIKNPGENVVIIATVERTAIERGRRPKLRMLLRDDSGTIAALFFAGISYYSKTIRNGMRLLVSGKVQWYGVPQFVHPAVEQLAAGTLRPQIAFMPVYPLTGGLREAGLAQKGLCKAILWVLDHIEHFPQVLPARVEEQKNFPPLATCLKKIHLPDNPDLLQQYCARLTYEELWRLAITARISRQNFALPGMSMDDSGLAPRFEKSLPFILTDAQRQAIAVLRADAKSPNRMHRLLQGDVGCGKTVVAFYSCCAALGSGRQVAWLTPTEILARQTAARLKQWCDPLNISIACLTAATPPAEKKEILRGCLDGGLRVIVGTHSLLQPTVRFGKLGMVVVDEQHRFGAGQRLTIAQKNPAADMLLMSATPIPQSLAQTIYGDLDIVSITALPPGRHEVMTRIVPKERRDDMERFVAEQIKDQTVRARAYYVVPCIESDPGESADLADVKQTFAKLTRGTFSQIHSGFLHGRMTSADKENAMNSFAAGKTSLLVSTTVIEVGLDVAEATIMIIENAERFGLAQLHQLRGRVGRSDKQSFCFLLMDESADELAQKRLNYFVKNHDGFKIAEADLSLRGPGEVVGVRQSGWDDLKMVDILRDADLYREIQQTLNDLQQKR